MTGVIDKIKEKAKESKDLVTDNTKDVVDDIKNDHSTREGERNSRYTSASVTEEYNSKSSSTSEEDIKNTTTKLKQTSNSSGIVDWDSIIHKGVRTKDMQPVGNVTAVTDNSVVITSEGARDEFNIPKEEVEAFNGAEVALNTTLDRFEQFKVKVPR